MPRRQDQERVADRADGLLEGVRPEALVQRRGFVLVYELIDDMCGEARGFPINFLERFWDRRKERKEEGLPAQAVSRERGGGGGGTDQDVKPIVLLALGVLAVLDQQVEHLHHIVPADGARQGMPMLALVGVQGGMRGVLLFFRRGDAAGEPSEISTRLKVL